MRLLIGSNFCFFYSIHFTLRFKLFIWNQPKYMMVSVSLLSEPCLVAKRRWWSSCVKYRHFLLLIYAAFEFLKCFFGGGGNAFRLVYISVLIRLFVEMEKMCDVFWSFWKSVWVISFLFFGSDLNIFFAVFEIYTNYYAFWC